MFARHVSMKLKANSAPEFNRIIDNEITAGESTVIFSEGGGLL